MSLLLRLPRELRDQIYSYVVLAEKTRPDLKESFDQLVNPRMSQNDSASRRTFTDGTVLYLPQHDLNTSMSLLQVSRQIHAEVLEVLSRIEASPLTCSLDIIILDEMLLLPTWLSVPSHRTSVDTVKVTFRIAGSFRRKGRHDKDGPYDRFPGLGGFNGGDGGGPYMKYQLYEILNRFIRDGPAGKVRDEEMSKHVTAKCIRINVLTPEEVPKEKFVGPLSGPRVWRRGRDVQGGVLDPHFLADFVWNQLGALLRSEYRDFFQYGKILFEHVDEIVLCKDGAELKRWNVAECLQAVSVEERYISRDQMSAYKQEVWQMRRARGLKVLED